MERPLGALEHSQWLYDQIHPLHFAIAAKIRGEFSIDQLQTALAQVQQQHPLLRVSIATNGSQPKYIEANHCIPLRVVPRTDDSQWQRELELEMTKSFDWSIAPLARAVLIQSGIESELIILYHHAIADGMSGAYLVGDIMRGLVQTDPTHHELTTAIPIEFAYPIPSEKIAATSSTTYHTVISTRPRPQIRTKQLSAELTQQLSHRCRQEQTTVHGAICAAFLSSLAQQQPASSPLRCLSPINVRSALTLPNKHALGMYISYGVTTHDVFPESAFWDLARSVKSQLTQLDIPNKLPAELAHRQSILATLPPAEIVVEGMRIQHGYDLLVTNLGRLQMPQQYGSLKLEELYGPAVMASLDRERIVGVATLGDRLSLTVLVAPTPDTDWTTTDWAATNFMATGLQLLAAAVAQTLV